MCLLKDFSTTTPKNSLKLMSFSYEFLCRKLLAVDGDYAAVMIRGKRKLRNYF